MELKKKKKNSNKEGRFHLGSRKPRKTGLFGRVEKLRRMRTENKVLFYEKSAVHAVLEVEAQAEEANSGRVRALLVN